MKDRMFVLILAMAALALPAKSQSSSASPLTLPPAVEKELAAHASDVTEVTLNKSMLGFAAKFMNDNDKNEAAARQLIDGLDGIYVRDYEFDKPGEYSMDDIENLRKQFDTPEWQPMVRERDRKSGDTTDVLMKVVNGQSQGMFVLDAEPKELSIVLILGPIRMDQLGALKGLGGLGNLGNIPNGVTVKGKAKDNDK
ncbi:MAG TPA: DUF4252 domain-containing protein [Terracidiphilus sp.]|nr:DUF4252 domain-containing protein [Terracidiphilus sp.]